MTLAAGSPDLRNLALNEPGRNLIIVVTIFVFFDFIFIGIRLYARKIKKRYLDTSDYAILFGFVSSETKIMEKCVDHCQIVSFAGYILQIIQVVHAGLGLNPFWIIENLGADRFRFLGKCVFASNVIFNVCTGAIKVGIHVLSVWFGTNDSRFPSFCCTSRSLSLWSR
jgi:hypothetical protein